MKENIYVATIINYTVEQNSRFTYTTYRIASSLKGLQAKLKREMMDNTELSGIESYIIDYKAYTLKEAKEMRLS